MIKDIRRILTAATIEGTSVSVDWRSKDGGKTTIGKPVGEAHVKENLFFIFRVEGSLPEVPPELVQIPAAQIVSVKKI